MNEFKAKASFRRISTRRVAKVADLIRGRNVLEALDILAGTKMRAADVLTKLVRSARANALHLDGQKSLNVNADSLVISTLLVDGGPIIGRFRPMSMGRGGSIRKRTTHITVVLKEPLGSAGAEE